MSESVDRRIFKALDPAKMLPHGDRLIVEKIDVDAVGFSGEFTFHIAGSDGDPEEANGYYFGRVIAVGSGHRLEADVTVPMPFEPGEVWMIERFSGRQLVIRGKKYRVVNQIDVFCHVPELEAALNAKQDAA